MSKAKTQLQARWAELAGELAGVGYWRMDAVTGDITWSANMFRMMGFPPGEQPPLAEAMARVHPEDRKDANARLKQNLAGKTAFSMSRIIWPSGEVRHLESRNACEFDAQGRVVAILGTSLDVTERIRMQELVAASEVHFRTLAESCPDIITRCTIDGAFTYVSPATLSMLGYHPEEVINRTAYEFMHPHDVARLKKALGTYLEGARDKPIHLNCRMIHKNGRTVWVESHPRAILDPVTGEVIEVQDIIRDVSDKKRDLLRVA